MNIQILGAMLRNSCKKMNFIFVLELMEITIKENIKPNAKFIEHLEALYKDAKKESQNEVNTISIIGSSRLVTV